MKNKTNKYSTTLFILNLLSIVAAFVCIALLLTSCSSQEVKELSSEHQCLTMPDGFECQAEIAKINSVYGPAYSIAPCDGTWILNLTNARVINCQ